MRMEKGPHVTEKGIKRKQREVREILADLAKENKKVSQTETTSAKDSLKIIDPPPSKLITLKHG